MDLLASAGFLMWLPTGVVQLSQLNYEYYPFQRTEKMQVKEREEIKNQNVFKM